MDPLPPPPPYTPHDPHSPGSDSAQAPPARATMRGGYLNIVDDPEEAALSPAALYAEERPLTVVVPSFLAVLVHTITPTTTRDELAFTDRIAELQLHDVHLQDWATFVNYIVAELHGDAAPVERKTMNRMSLEDFQDCQRRIQAVVAEWNGRFLGPRYVNFVPYFSYEIVARQPSPAPSYRTFQSVPPFRPGGGSGPFLVNAPSRLMPMHGCRPMPHVNQMGPRFPAGPFPPSPMQIIPPQISQPTLPSHHWLAGGKHPAHRLDGLTNGGRGHRGRGRHHTERGPYRRSASLSPSGSSSSGSARGRRGRGRGHHHHHASSSSSSSSSSPDRTRQRDGKHRRHRRSSSTSSSSSSSSDSSVSSISSDDFEGADEAEIKKSLENFRLNPARKDHINTAVRQLHSELRSYRKGNRRGFFELRRNSIELTKEMRAIYKAQKREIKSTVKAAMKEAHKHKYALQRQHKAEKRIQKAEKHCRKIERRVRGSGSASFQTSMPGSLPDAIQETPGCHRGSRSERRGCRGPRNPTDNFAWMAGLNPAPRETHGRGIAASGPDGALQESGVVPTDAAYPLDAKVHVPDEGLAREMTMEPEPITTTRQASAEEQARIVEQEAESMEQKLRGMAIQEKQMRKQREVIAKQLEKVAERQEKEAEREAKQRKKEAERRAKQRGKEVGRWDKDAHRVSKEVERAAEQRCKEDIERVKMLHKRSYKRQQGLQADQRTQQDVEGEQRVMQADRARDQDRIVQQQARNQAVAAANQAAAAASHASAEASSSTRGGVPGSQGYGTYFENMGRGIEEWGERFGRDMEQWGDRFGKDMEAKFS